MTQYSGKVIRKTPVTPTQQSASGVWKLNEQAAAIRNNTWPVAGVPDPISRSVRLRSSVSAYLNRTPATTTNQQTFTLSFWTKRGTIGGGDQTLFSFGNGGGSGLTFEVYWGNSNTELVARTLNIGVSAPWEVASSAVFRDPSAWYHIVIAVDTPQATNTNRVKMYVNGVQITAFRTATWPTQNYNTGANTNTQHRIGLRADGVQYLDGYLTEINFIDGQALTPSSFGTTDPLTGAWIPMQYTGTYGTNGFYVDFRDNTSTTTIGYDYSGNSNNWTANNISLTAGATYDSMLDVPTPWIGYSTTTDTSAVTRGNYPVLNPLSVPSVFSLSNANLNFSASGSTPSSNVRGTFGVSSGKWYWEVVPTDVGGGPNIQIGIIDIAAATTGSTSVFSGGFAYYASGNKMNNSSSTAYGASYTNGDVIGVAFDADAGTITFYKNNVSQGVAFTGISATTTWAPAVGIDLGGTTRTVAGSINFGQRPLTYSPPSGYKTLCATNLPTPTILNGASYMAATTYTGNGTTQSITNTVNGVSFQPDLVWMKNRSSAVSHYLVDAVRGSGLSLNSNTTNAEGNLSGPWQSFASNGFNLGTDSGTINQSGQTYVGWQWKEGATQGFDIVTWAGNSTSGRTIAHSLGVAPNMIITKSRTNASSWVVGIGNISGFSVNDYLTMNTTNAKGSSSTFYQAYGSSTFTVGVSAADEMNKTGNNYVSYLFSEVAGFSKFGSYTGNGSNDGPFVYTGFRPRWIMLKNTTTAGNGAWVMFDTTRNPSNVQGLQWLFADSSNAESTANSFGYFDILSNGFKCRGSGGNINVNNEVYLYAAFAENPFKYSNAR